MLTGSRFDDRIEFEIVLQPMATLFTIFPQEIGFAFWKVIAILRNTAKVLDTGVQRHPQYQYGTTQALGSGHTVIHT
jgi:hypothetical protein